MDRQFKADAERVQASLSQISDRAYAIIRDFVDANGGSYDFDEDDAPYAGESPVESVYEREGSFFAETAEEVFCLKELGRLEIIELAEYIIDMEE